MGAMSKETKEWWKGLGKDLEEDIETFENWFEKIIHYIELFYNINYFKIWKSLEWDLNPRPNAYEAFALPGWAIEALIICTQSL